jgi:hypothetical protein
MVSDILSNYNFWYEGEKQKPTHVVNGVINFLLSFMFFFSISFSGLHLPFYIDRAIWQTGFLGAHRPFAVGQYRYGFTPPAAAKPGRQHQKKTPGRSFMAQEITDVNLRLLVNRACRIFWQDGVSVSGLGLWAQRASYSKCPSVI